MLIQSSANLKPALRALPGTPVAALDADGNLVGAGLRLDSDPAKHVGDVQRFSNILLDNSERIGSAANLLSSGLDLAAFYQPDVADGMAKGGAVIALMANGLALAHAIDKGDTRAITIATIKTGADAIDLIEKSGVLGSVPALHGAVLILKSGSAAVETFYPKPDKV